MSDPTSPDPSEAAVPEGPHGLWDVIRHMDSFAAARERDVRANRDAPDNINEVVSRVVRSWIDALSRQPSAPERPDLTREALNAAVHWYHCDAGTPETHRSRHEREVDDLLAALSALPSTPVRPDLRGLTEALRLAEWRARDYNDLSTAYNVLTDAIRAALRAEQVERPSLDVPSGMWTPDRPVDAIALRYTKPILLRAMAEGRDEATVSGIHWTFDALSSSESARHG